MTPVTPRRPLDFARWYASEGLRVTPVNGKIPLIKEWQKRPAPTDLQLVEWFGNGHDYNLAVICGEISRFVAIDLDGSEGGKKFDEILPRLSPSLRKKIGSTRTVLTPSGGRHFHFQTDESVRTKHMWQGEGHNGIELRGNGSLLVVPPSKLPERGHYLFEKEAELQRLTAADLDELTTAFAQKNLKKGKRTTPPRSLSEEQLERLADIMTPHYVEGARDYIVMYASGYLRKERVPESDVLKLVEMLAGRTADPEKDSRLVVVQRTFSNSLQAVAGFTELNSYLPSDVMRAIKEVLCSWSKDKPSKAKSALELANAYCVELFTDQHGTAYAAVQVDNHIETLSVQRSRFRNWLAKLYYEETNGLLNGEDIGNVLAVLRAKAEFGENRRHLDLRVGGSEDGSAIYYDLTNPEWEAVKFTADGWKVEQAPIMFTRYNNQQAQVYPQRDYPADILDRFFALTNVKTPGDRLLVTCYIIALFWPDIPKPVLSLHGEQGASKSTLQELIKDLVDPSSVKSLSFPRDINELVQSLSHNYVAYFDNVSHIKDWISNELCKAVTGSGFLKRQLYTNDDDIVYSFKRCIGFTGINLGANKADLLDRCLIIQLEHIPNDKRRKIKDIWTQFQQINPHLLGFIFETLSKVLKARRNGAIELKELPRMADFAEIAEMISRSIGERDGAFLDAYYENIGLQTTEAIEANPVAQCLSTFIETNKGPEWTGTTSALLEELEKIATQLKINMKTKDWPKASNILSRRLNEVMTNLREVGIMIERTVEDSHKNIRLVRIRKLSSQSPPSPQVQDLTPS